MKNIRTRFAPSPTGFMHVGNLRTALYSFLIARSSGGKFILRIEDTDQKRKVDEAIDIIFRTLKKASIQHDEGPDIGGDFGPYIQSERLNKYLPLAKNLVENKFAYYCFCDASEQGGASQEHSKNCRNLSDQEVTKLLEKNTPYAIRQRMPTSGSTAFDDAVFGRIVVENKELEDQVLIKRDGYPTYNFANVVDDHDMKITHVVRGSEYLTSTPKYNLLYEAFGWEVPTYVHTGLIMGQNEDGTTSKLSKRHGSTSFEDLEKKGYLPEVIVNYVALLGWSPRDNRELLSMKELIESFSIGGINKSPSVFDFSKLNWINSEYLKSRTDEDFIKICLKKLKEVFHDGFDFFDKENLSILSNMLKPRVVVLNQIPDMLSFLKEIPNYDSSMFINKKSKSNKETSGKMLSSFLEEAKDINEWKFENLKDKLSNLAKKLDVKNGTLMWPIRIAISGTLVTPGGAPEILTLLGKSESVKRVSDALKFLM